ncbi:MAG: FHA domain-containing protein [Kofleriaceae bacterium]|nr:FHA domain-containing protein [Kofleriaceae bacterium]
MRLLRIAVSRGAAARAIDVAPGPVRVGRAATCAVRLFDEAVAAEHLVLHLDGAAWQVEPRGGPVRVGAREVAVGARAPLAAGVAVTVAGWTITVDDAPSDAVPAGVERTASLARELVRDLLGGDEQGGPVLEIEAGPDAGRKVVLPAVGERLVIGRGEGAIAVILDPDLSRQHVAVDRSWDGVRVVDLGSKNGTRVAGRLAPRVEPGALVRDGDTVEAGGTRLRLVDPADRYLRDLEARLGPEVGAPSAPDVTQASGPETGVAVATPPTTTSAAARAGASRRCRQRRRAPAARRR